MPAACSGATNFAGLPADVVTKRSPASQTKRSMASSFRKRMGRFTPKGNPLACICAISRWQAAVSPDDVSMMPRPPARDTALANGERAIQPMGACTMG
jgi:hypothetical protein